MDRRERRDLGTLDPRIAHIRHFRLLVDGEWREAESGARGYASNPATGEVFATYADGARADARAAVSAASAAASAWAARSPFDRAAFCTRVVDAIEARRDDLAAALTEDQGKPLYAEAYDEVDELAVYFRMAAEDAVRTTGLLPASADASRRVLTCRVPVGVVGVITPWNWPYTMAAELVAPALGAGNAVVWVPAPTTAACSALLAEVVSSAEPPPGVFSFVTGPGAEVGDEVAGSPAVDGVGFIGSVATGRHVAARAAGKALVLELGGNGPLVVLDDADLDAAAAATIEAAFLCAGQSCTAGGRFLVHRAVRDAYLERVLDATRDVRLGDPLAKDTTMGPLNNEPTAAKVDRHLADARARGARILMGGGRVPGFPTDLFYAPTVLDAVPVDSQIATEETFGPVVPIVEIGSDEEALALTNASPYGLQAAVFTTDLGRGLRFAERARTGWVNVNASTNYWESHLPFGGRSGSVSGRGKVGGRSVLDAFTEPKTITFLL